MWLLRSLSQDSEHHKSAPQQKTAYSDLEKLRGYHELAKVGFAYDVLAMALFALYLPDAPEAILLALHIPLQGMMLAGDVL